MAKTAQTTTASRKAKQVADVTLAEFLDQLTVEGEVYEKLQDNKVRCYACGHRCLIPDGQRGICKVRFNEGGVLKVPHGYVAGLQSDPIEKKPFFHVYPGSDALTFGMLGCDYHCPYCFRGDTPVVTDQGVLPIEEIFRRGWRVIRQHDGEVALVEGMQAVVDGGRLRPILKAFRHRYSGPMVVVIPYYLPPLRCTPDHRIYACTKADGSDMRPIPAGELTSRHYLVIPRNYDRTSSLQILDVYELLQNHSRIHQVPHALTEEQVTEIVTASTDGVSSRELAERFGKRPDYIRHVRSKVRRGLWVNEREVHIQTEGEYVRFPKEHRPGIPRYIPLDENLAYLLGLYCADGCVSKQANRPGSYTLMFSFNPTEKEAIANASRALESIFGVRPRPVHRDTTVGLDVYRGTVALLFSSLCGASAREKRVPTVLFHSPPSVVEAFLKAYVHGDGHFYDSGKVSITTVSRDLAYGVAWLALKLGYLPSVYAYERPLQGQIEGRTVHQAAEQLTVVWYLNGNRAHRYVETENYYLIPIRSVTTEHFEGEVYNLEVAEEHQYLANFFLVKNCQNWLSSQALRDPAARVHPTIISAEQIVELAKRYGARAVVSSYNEPLITAEWAVEIFKLAKAEGLLCGFVSNGNATPEVLDYLRPWMECYKVDLKSMSQKNYQYLGGRLENVLETIKMAYERGFWVEIVTLLVPGWNTSDDELRAAAEFIASVSPDIPWHVTAFHKDYKMQEPDNTTPDILMRAAEIGKEAGLHYVYAGNLPGQVGDLENTYCPNCRTLLIERYGYVILDYRLTGQGTCPNCGTKIPGIWPKDPQEVRRGGEDLWFLRRPRVISRR